jgi:hypothetical protein
MSGKLSLLPCSARNVVGNAKAVWSYNKVLFVDEPLESIEVELAAFFDTIGDAEEFGQSRPAQPARIRAGG